MRITKKKLIELCDDVLNRTELPFFVSDIATTRFTSDQYECGACKQYIYLKSEKYTGITALCFYSKKELEFYLSNGYKLILLPPDSRRSQYNWEFEVIKG